MPKYLSSKVLFFIGLILVTILSRWIPHAPNWTPVLALALFAGFRVSNKWIALSVPLSAMVVSDLLLGFHSTTWAVYLSLALIAILPVLASSLNLASGIALSLVSNICFFVVTNFAVWLSSGMYAKTAEGLWQAYVMALPFLTSTFASTVIALGLFYAVEHISLLFSSRQIVK